jgi:hypothetical protein
MPHSLDPARIEEILESIEEYHLPRLTKWELSFFTSIKDQHDRTGFLSEKQLETLEKIWLKCP